MNESILKRRSIRRYQAAPVPQEAIREVLRAGMLAPSSKNRQPWKFIVVSGRPKEEMLLAMRRGLDRERNRESVLPQSRPFLGGAEFTWEIMRQAPVCIFVINTLGASLFDPITTEERVYEICNAQSIGAAMENMTLTATALGLGSLWICDIFFAYPELTDWLHTKGSLFAALALGYADEQPPARPRKEWEEAVEWRT